MSRWMLLSVPVCFDCCLACVYLRTLLRVSLCLRFCILPSLPIPSPRSLPRLPSLSLAISLASLDHGSQKKGTPHPNQQARHSHTLAIFTLKPSP
ncbi:MAG: hypothetical protein J3R72DRAFT_446944 [Linnemannia gamsii]|nr:MAG: hypothetical protein J3R72DRAFT_446944 [Linnemannia gamsii]